MKKEQCTKNELEKMAYELGLAKEHVIFAGRRSDVSAYLENMDIGRVNANTFKFSLEVLAHRNNISWNFSEPCPSFFTNIENSKFRATLVHPCTG